MSVIGSFECLSAVSPCQLEGKRGNFALRKLKHQLWANMITASIMRFINTIPHLNERGILEVDTIIGYGMAYTGIECIGFNMKFGGQTEIISKFDISQWPQQYAAAFANFIIDSNLLTNLCTSYGKRIISKLKNY